MNYSYPETRPVLIGEGTNVEKEHIPGSCPRCNDSVTLDQMKTIFTDCEDENRLKECMGAYNDYMSQLGMNTCWNKAHFFAQAAVEVGRSLQL